MCIIIVKPKGRELPSNEIFENCWKHNYHGAGFMYHINNKVIIDKGFMTLYDFLKRMSSIKNEINIIYKPIITENNYGFFICLIYRFDEYFS